MGLEVGSWELGVCNKVKQQHRAFRSTCFPQLSPKWLMMPLVGNQTGHLSLDSLRDTYKGIDLLFHLS